MHVVLAVKLAFHCPGVPEFYLSQKFVGRGGERGGKAGLMDRLDRLGGQREWVREGDVPPPAQSVGS